MIGGIFVITHRKERRRQNRWDRLHLKTASCRIPIQDYNTLKLACYWNNINMNRLLRSFITWFIKQEYGESAVSDKLQHADIVMKNLLNRNM